MAVISSRHLIRRLTPRALRNWVRSPTKSFRYVTDRLAFAAGLVSIVTPAEGWAVRCHPAARRSFQVFREDPEQAAELREFAALCTATMRFLDVGAHYGLFTLAALHFGSPDARALCVDPSPRVIRILETNLALNSAGARVCIVHCALGGEDGELPMLTTGPMSGDYFVVPTEQRTDTIRVRQLSLRSLLAGTGFIPTHVKLDVEGCEYEVLESGRELLEQIKPVIFLELHGPMIRARGKDPAKVVENLHKAGYRRFLLEGREVQEPEIARRNYSCRLICLP
jgi:FkbM family methyltransferase